VTLRASNQVDHVVIAQQASHWQDERMLLSSTTTYMVAEDALHNN